MSRGDERLGPGVRPFFVSATLCLLVAGGVALARLIAPPGLPDLSGWHWPLLHLMMVGGVTQLILGAMVLFAVTLLGTTAPPGWLTRLQWLLVNLAALGLAGGAFMGWLPLSLLGASAALGAVASTLVTLRQLRRRSLQRPGLTLRYYEAALVCLLLGMSLGLLMLLGWSDLLVPRHQARLAHLHVNLTGGVMVTIIGTLRLFFPTTLAAPDRFLASPRVEYWPLVGGAALSVAGWLWGVMALVAVGGLSQALAVGACSLAVTRQWSAAPPPRSLAAGHLLAAVLWLVVMTLAAMMAGALRPLDTELTLALNRAVAVIGFLGFIGQTILGAWTHLFSVVVGPPAGPPRLETMLQPRLQAILRGQRLPQLVLTNLGATAVTLGLAVGPLQPSAASTLTRVGAIALATVLLLVAVKASRVLGLLWRTRRAAPPAPSPAVGHAAGRD